MTILLLTPCIPYPPSFGGSVRMYHLIRQLSRRHTLHLVTLNAPGNPPDTGELESLCESVRVVDASASDKRIAQFASLLSPRSFQHRVHHTPAMAKALRQALADYDVDLVLAEFSQMASLAIPPDVPLVVDQHNVEFDLIRRMAKRSSGIRKLYNSIEAAKYRSEELRALRASALTIATSKRDVDLMTELVPGLKTAVIENGVDTEFFRNPGRPAKPNTLVFVGAMHYFPNEDAAHFYMRDIHPLLADRIPDLRVFFVGGKPTGEVTQYASDNVAVTGFVEDVRPYMHEASAFIVPLRMGGGTRFKVVEALAAGTPVVSTSLGSEGIPVTHGRELLIADTPREFADAVVRVLHDSDFADSLRTAGLDFVQKHFDWSVIGAKLNREIEKVADDG